MSNMMLCLASVSTLCCISADRYLAVVRPTRYKHLLTPKRATLMLMIVWFGSLSFSFVPLITDYEFHPGINNCFPAWHRSCVLYTFIVIFAFGAPLVTLLSTYGMIFHSVRRHTKKVTHWRVSSRTTGWLRDICNGTDTTASCAQASSASLNAHEEAKETRHRKKGISADKISENLMQSLSFLGDKEDCLKSRHGDKKHRSHSMGCNHTRPDEHFQELLFKLRAAAPKTTQIEENLQRRPRLCSLSLNFSVNQLVARTVSVMACPIRAQSNGTENTQSIARSPSLSCVNSSDPKELVSEDSNRLPMEQCLCKGTAHSSICLTLTSASTPVNGPDSAGTLSSVSSEFVPTSEEVSSDLLQRMRRSVSRPPTQDSQQCSSCRHPNTFLLPSAASSTSAQYVSVSSSSRSQPSRKNYDFQPKSLSLEKSLDQQPKKGTKSTQVAPLDKTSSPLVRLRAITKFKGKLRINRLPREYKIAKTGFTLVLVFFLSWGPYMMANNCQYSINNPLWVHRVAMWMVYLSCVLNPILYALSSRHIRLALSSHLKCLTKS
ncbi:uncharacterized protein [Montipora capricornis]|uniref:uncharacterized protein isoform X1 n=1 Tax=Montipora capricornis TaxID=246305 RepID=UPI0035F1DBB2